jgi:hypothetical protein
MSLYVFIAKEGFKSNPISTEAWLAAARQHHALCVEDAPGKKWGPPQRIFLKDQPKAWIELDRHGLVRTPSPSRDMVVVMFDLAAALGARVYSESLNPYRSPDDWEKRTREYRKKAEEKRVRHRRASVLWSVFFGVVLLTMGISLASHFMHGQ